MIETIEAYLLLVLPWSFFAKTAALGLMWYQLRFRTKAIGPLGVRINMAFRDQFIMSLFITCAMAIIATEVEPGEVDWPFVSLALAGIALWPFRAAYQHFGVYLTYRRMAKGR